MTEFKSVMVTGHRPQDFTPEQEAFAKESLKSSIQHLIKNYGMVEAISGMALGADTWWAILALNTKIPLAAYIPFEAQKNKWSAQDQEIWRKVRERASREVVLGDEYDVKLLHARNDAMIKDADLAIAVWNSTKYSGGTASAVKKIRAKKMPLVIIDIHTMKITRENF